MYLDLICKQFADEISQGRKMHCRGMFPTDGDPYMDYQLHAQAENILSLKSFIPNGAETRKFYSAGDYRQSLTNGEIKVRTCRFAEYT